MVLFTNSSYSPWIFSRKNLASNEIVKKWIAGNVTLWGPIQVETIHCEDHCMVGTLMSECYSIEVAILTLWGPLQVSIIHCQGIDV